MCRGAVVVGGGGTLHCHFAWIIRGGVWDQNKAWTRQQGIAAACSANGPPVLITSYCYGYLHAEAWVLSSAF